MSIFARISKPQTDALIVGLGNPGLTYAHTRHNAGFDALDELSGKTGVIVNKTRSRALTGSGAWQGHKIALARPQTYMNASGESVVGLMQWFKPGALIVIYDDIDLPLGSLRIRGSGSAGTHNGMRSIIAQLGTEEFPRVRVGVGKPPPEWDLKDWVLARFSDDERETFKKSCADAADAALLIVADGLEAAMQKFNKKHVGK